MTTNDKPVCYQIRCLDARMPGVWGSHDTAESRDALAESWDARGVKYETRDLYARPQPEHPKPECPCGEATCDEPWEPGCGLGRSEEHVGVYEQPKPVDERAAAEYAYSTTAFNYEANPVGSRDWCLFWNGWKARAEQPKPAGDDAAHIEVLRERLEKGMEQKA